MDDLILQVNHLSKSFGTHEVLKDIDFTVKRVTSPPSSALPAPARVPCFAASTCWKPPPREKSSTTGRTLWAGV